jgi:hypothetical protein
MNDLLRDGSMLTLGPLAELVVEIIGEVLDVENGHEYSSNKAPFWRKVRASSIHFGLIDGIKRRDLAVPAHIAQA